MYYVYWTRNCYQHSRPCWQYFKIIMYFLDMEWLNGPRESENMEVDIGFMPQMELKATRSSVQV